MKLLKAWALAGVAGLAISAPARAQTTPPPPVRQSVDGNGVDLFLGTLTVSSPAVTMGDAQTGISYYFVNRGSGWSDNVTAALDQRGSVVTVRLGTITDDFSASGTAYTSLEGRGATLTLSGAVYTYTASDGTVARFGGNANAAPYYSSLGQAIDITSPSGQKLVYTYTSVYYCDSGGYNCTSHSTSYRLSGITNSYGYQISLSYAGAGPPNPDDTNWLGLNRSGLQNWMTVNGASLVNLRSSSSPSRTLSGNASTSSFPTSTFSVIDPAGRTTTYRRIGPRVLGITSPGSSNENVTLTYTTVGSSSRVATVASAAGTWTYGAPTDASGARTVTVTNPSSQTTTYVFDIASQRLTSVTDALAHTSSWTYDSSGRMLTAVAPEGNWVEYVYDTRGNVTSTIAHAKPTSGQPNITTATAAYDATCSNAVTCNQPSTTTDALGNTTNYSYNPTHGGVTAVTLPAATSGAVRPEVRTSYISYTDQFGGTIYRATGTSTCRTTASCANGADETVTSVNYGTLAANNLQPVSMTIGAGDNSISSTTSVTYDPSGNVVSATAPSGAVSTFQYDADRWRTMTVSADPDGSGPLTNLAQRTNYNADGTVASVESGTATATFGSFSAFRQVATSNDSDGRPVQTTLTAGGTTYSVVQYSYDPVNRATCTAVRMNPAAWSSLPASACTLGTAGTNGPDRITRTIVDQVGRPTSVTTGYGTAAAAAEAATTYTNNGRTATVTDANGNRTGYTYDGYDRLSQTFYPSPTSAGTISTTDYETYGYDVQGNGTSWRRRDGRTLTFSYDAINRLTSKVVPDGCAPIQVGTCPAASATRDVYYDYDLMGHLTSARFDSATGAEGVMGASDALGRQVSSTTTMGGNSRTIGYQYDVDGNRVRLTYPDAFYYTAVYDALDRRTTSGIWTSPTGLLQNQWNVQGQLMTLFRNNAGTNFSYDPAGRLSSHGLAFAATASNLTTTLTYNAASQIVSRTRSNTGYAFNGYVGVSRPYATNGLNQYATAGSATFTYDASGNLISDGTNSYGYDGENRLVSASNGATLTYDPLGRLWRTTGGGVTTQFVYDGDQLSVEYDGAGTLLRRYVHEDGADTPQLVFDGTNFGTPHYLSADPQGSIVATSDINGTTITTNTYDEYGIPGSGNTGRFQYTGQAWLPELGMYYYKARMYSPTLGRFLQTDPIGYGDGLNWYNYVGGDPVNLVDPSGLDDAIVVTAPSTDIIVTARRPMQPSIAVTPSIPFPQNNLAPPDPAFDILVHGRLRGSSVGSTSRLQNGCRRSGSVGAFLAPGAAAAEASLASRIAGALSAGAARLFGALGALLSLSGDTPQPRGFRHYGYSGQAGNFAGGLRPGSFATTASGAPLTGSQAQSLLALPSRGSVPDAYYNVTVGSNVPVVGPSAVAPANGQPGGGIEYTFSNGTPPGSVGPPNAIPAC